MQKQSQPAVTASPTDRLRVAVIGAGLGSAPHFQSLEDLTGEAELAWFTGEAPSAWPAFNCRLKRAGPRGLKTFLKTPA